MLTLLQAINMLAALDKRGQLPFRTRNYAPTKVSSSNQNKQASERPAFVPVLWAGLAGSVAFLLSTMQVMLDRVPLELCMTTSGHCLLGVKSEK